MVCVCGGAPSFPLGSCSMVFVPFNDGPAVPLVATCKSSPSSHSSDLGTCSVSDVL